MRFATFNIYWFGTSRPIVRRAASDDTLVANVLARLDADVFALEEICDLPRLERALAEASAISGRDLRMRVGADVVTSARPHEYTDGGAQKVVFAWDARRVAPEAWGPLPVNALRPPLWARFRGEDGLSVDAVAVHMKSGRLGAPMEDPNAVQRHAEAIGVAGWLAGGAPGPAGVATDRTLLLGDLNARRGDPSLAPLWALPGWEWPAPEVPEDDPWTTFLDRDVIDLVGVGPGLRVVTPPRAWDWDRDPRVAPPGWFRQVDDFLAQRARDFPKAPVENLYRVSDHRPVRITVA